MVTSQEIEKILELIKKYKTTNTIEIFNELEEYVQDIIDGEVLLWPTTEIIEYRGIKLGFFNSRVYKGICPSGLTCYITKYNLQNPCGYIVSPNKEFRETDTCNIHGGITYIKNTLPNIENIDENHTVFGFDTMHYDSPYVSVGFMIKQILIMDEWLKD